MTRRRGRAYLEKEVGAEGLALNLQLVEGILEREKELQAGVVALEVALLHDVVPQLIDSLEDLNGGVHVAGVAEVLEADGEDDLKCGEGRVRLGSP